MDSFKDILANGRKSSACLNGRSFYKKQSYILKSSSRNINSARGRFRTTVSISLNCGLSGS